ncbi:MAG: DEAD/DEAH box helicase [Halobacteriota archaeon]|nr:DEAD/DEAH box helicase [Halobacteriota archaeon]
MNTTFKLLDPKIQTSLKKLGFTRPTEPQKEAIPLILNEENLLLVAPTGSGKTEAAVLPIFHFLLSLSEEERRGISVLYITPLRALNRDMLSRLECWGMELGIKIQVRHGDTPRHVRRSQTLKPPDMLITTPETVQAILIGSRLREHLRSLKYVIIDEVHELAISKRGSQLSIALERLVELAGDFQRIGLSATVGTPQKVADFFVGSRRDVSIIEVSMLKLLNFKVLDPKPIEEDKKSAKTLMIDEEMAAQLRIISEMVSKHNSTLIFVNTRQAAESLGSRFNLLGAPIGVHHGSLSKEARIEAEDAFKSGNLKGLICTSSMELGIDIGSVDLVIQYMSPRQVTRLIQRVGRSGHRIDRTSRGVIIAINSDDIMESWVITRQAKIGKIEAIEVQKSPLDTLSNQICGIILDSGEMRIENLHSIIKRASPFKELKRERLLKVLKQMDEQNLVRYDSGNSSIRRTRKTLSYYYQNLSMIPDEKKYDIYDIIGGKHIGALDEAFVVNFADPGAVFITKGDMWRVVDLEEERIKVEQIENPMAEVPNWVGEEIPVPFEIAQDVGRIREKIASYVESKKSDEEIFEELGREYATDPYTTQMATQTVREQIKGGFTIPTHDRIVIEIDGRSIVINACFGHKCNEALGRVITSLIAARFGSSVAMRVDPYRIELELPKKVSSAYLEEVILSVQPEYITPIIEITLNNASLIKWKLFHVARKFGVLEKDMDHRRVDMNKLLGIFKDTPMYEGAIEDIFYEKLDISDAKKVIKGIHSGDIILKFGGPSPMGRSYYSSGRELLAPENVDRSIVLALKNRILNDRVLLFCLTCKEWQSKRMVKRVPEEIVCPICGSKLIAALKPWEAEEIKIVKKKVKTREEEERVRRVYKNANLVLSNGKKAVIALASRGVGPDTASRIIGKFREGEEEFYRDIMQAERNYVLTKRFWD